MSSPIRILVALDAGAERDTVEAVLPVRAGVELAGVADSLEAGRYQLAEEAIDAVLVDSTGSADGALSFAEEVAGHYPDRAVLLLHAGTPNGPRPGPWRPARRTSSSFRRSNGQPPSPADRERVAAELQTALQKAVARRRRATAGPRAAKGRMIVVLGPKGGGGQDARLVEPGRHARRNGRAGGAARPRPPVRGHRGSRWACRPRRPSTTSWPPAVRWTPRSSPTISSRTSRARGCFRHPPGRIRQRRSVSSSFARLFDVVRATEDWIIVDGSPGFTPEIIAAIDASTDICMVGTVDAPALKNTKLGLETLELMGVEPGRVKLVLNRADSRVGVTPEDVEAITGRAADALVPSHRDVALLGQRRASPRGQPAGLATGPRTARSCGLLFRCGRPTQRRVAAQAVREAGLMELAQRLTGPEGRPSNSGA